MFSFSYIYIYVVLLILNFYLVVNSTKIHIICEAYYKYITYIYQASKHIMMKMPIFYSLMCFFTLCVSFISYICDARVKKNHSIVKLKLLHLMNNMVFHNSLTYLLWRRGRWRPNLLDFTFVHHLMSLCLGWRLCGKEFFYYSNYI